MNRMDGGNHALLVLEGGCVLDRKMGVPAIVSEVAAMRARHGPSAEILVDGAEFEQKAVARLATEIEPRALHDIHAFGLRGTRRRS